MAGGHRLPSLVGGGGRGVCSVGGWLVEGPEALFNKLGLANHKKSAIPTKAYAVVDALVSVTVS